MIAQTREALICLLDARRALNIATASDKAEAFLAKGALDLVDQALEYLYLADDELLKDERRPKYRTPL